MRHMRKVDVKERRNMTDSERRRMNEMGKEFRRKERRVEGGKEREKRERVRQGRK